MGLPQAFGRYRVTQTLGQGAMGEVYAATDEVLGREVAIKTLKGASGVAARFIDDRFRNEARAIAQLTHPGVVQVFDIDVTANPPYLVMERVSGPALSARIEQGPLSPAELVPLGIQIANALAAAHAVNVVHRDVKPSNILGAGPGTWKLADFGVAHVPDSSLTITGQFVGSPAYAPPEALIKGVSTPAGDVYGLGATLYEAATGTWPRAEASGALLAPVPPVRERAPHLPAHLAAAIDRACSLEASQRPSAAELAHLIASQTSSSTIPAPPKALRWKPWAIAGAIVLLIIVLVATRGGDKKPGPSQFGGPGADVNLQVPIPPGMDRKASKDWNKIVDALRHSDIGGAQRHLDEWERKYGECAESASLRQQLDSLPSGPREDD